MSDNFLFIFLKYVGIYWKQWSNLKVNLFNHGTRNVSYQNVEISLTLVSSSIRTTEPYSCNFNNSSETSFI